MNLQSEVVRYSDAWIISGKVSRVPRHKKKPQHADAEVLNRFRSSIDNDRQPRDIEVDCRVAAIYASRARAEATEANRRHDFDAARRVIERTAERIRHYAGDDPALNEYWRSLLESCPRCFKSSLMRSCCSLRLRDDYINRHIPP